METLVRDLAEYVALALDATSVLIIVIGAIEAVWRLSWALLRNRMNHGVRRAAWLSLARWLVLALEFMLASDIVGTVVTPTWEQLVQLGAIAVIRTFLNYFLEKDLEEAVHIGDAT